MVMPISFFLRYVYIEKELSSPYANGSGGDYGSGQNP